MIPSGAVVLIVPMTTCGEPHYAQGTKLDGRQMNHNHTFTMKDLISEFFTVPTRLHGMMNLSHSQYRLCRDLWCAKISHVSDWPSRERHASANFGTEALASADAILRSNGDIGVYDLVRFELAIKRTASAVLHAHFPVI